MDERESKDWDLRLKSPVVPFNKPRNGGECRDAGSGALFWATLCLILGIHVQLWNQQLSV